MKRVLVILLGALSIVLFTACDDDSILEEEVLAYRNDIEEKKQDVLKKIDQLDFKNNARVYFYITTIDPWSEDFKLVMTTSSVQVKGDQIWGTDGGATVSFAIRDLYECVLGNNQLALYFK